VKQRYRVFLFRKYRHVMTILPDRPGADNGIEDRVLGPVVALVSRETGFSK
jgi:hypothetical protein